MCEARKKEKPAKDHPHPLRILRDERAKTRGAQEKADAARREIDGRMQEKTGAHAEKLAQLETSMRKTNASRITVRQEAADQLTREVDAAAKTVLELEERLAAERKRLLNGQKGRTAANAALRNETAAVEAETQAALKAKRKEQAPEMKALRKERCAVYRQTQKTLCRERLNTLKRTTKEAVLYPFDLATRFYNATRRSIVATFRGAAQGFNEQTPFGVERKEPLQTAKQKPPKA